MPGGGPVGRDEARATAAAAARTAVLRFLGLDPASPAAVEVLRDAGGFPSHFAVRFPLDGREDLVVEVFPARSGAPAWIVGPDLSISYRLLLGDRSPFGHPAARAVLDRIGAAAGRHGAAPGSPGAQAVLEALAPARVGGSAPPAPSRRLWLEALEYFHSSRLPAAQEAVLLAALEAGIVRHLAGVPSAALPELARACGCDEGALAVFLRALVALGLVETADGAAFRLAEEARVLAGPAEPLLAMNRMLRELWRDHLVTALRGGRLAPAQMPVDRRDLWAAMVGALGFLQSRQAGRGTPPFAAGGALGRARRLMDVGAGSGELSAALLLADPELHLVAVDYPLALPEARACYERRGLLARVTLVEGEFYDPAWIPPAGCDAVWLANTLHVASLEENRLLLGKLHAALPDGGRLVVVERVIDGGDVEGAMNDLLWSFFTDRGRAYALDEVRRLVAEAGFAEIVASMPGEGAAQVVATKGAV